MKTASAITMKKNISQLGERLESNRGTRMETQYSDLYPGQGLHTEGCEVDKKYEITKFIIFHSLSAFH